jgi:hypothetical protein
MIKVESSKKIEKIINSKQKSSRIKYNNFLKKLMSTPKDGEFYKLYKGERLSKVEKICKVNFEIHSIEIEIRLRLVYELENRKEGVSIFITDLANHEYRGQPYTKQYS